MDQFATLEPVKLYPSTFLGRAASASFSSPLAKGQNRKAPNGLAAAPATLVGRLPADLHLLVLAHLPVPDIPAYGRCCRATAGFVKDERVWERRWKALGVERDRGNDVGKDKDKDKDKLNTTDDSVKNVLEMLERKVNEVIAGHRAAAPPTIPVDDVDEFGDFTAGDVMQPPPEEELGDFVGAFRDERLYLPNSPRFSAYAPGGMQMQTHKEKEKESFRTKYMHVHNLLKPLTALLSSPPHIVLADLAAYVHSSPSSAPSLWSDAIVLKLLSSFLSPTIQPLRQWSSLQMSLQTAMDRFDSNLLAAFDVADGRGDEAGMREAAEASWEIWNAGAAGAGDWEMGKVWAEKREIFYEQGKWRALDNFTSEKQLNFAAMDEFMDDILAAIQEHGARAVRVFPPASQVLLLFSERLANEVISEYITTLLSHAREISISTYLRSCAASFKVAWKMVDAIMDVAKLRKGKEGQEAVGRIRAEDVIYQMFETNMDEYLDEEVEAVKGALDAICKGWDQEASSSPTTPTHSRRFLPPSSHSSSLSQSETQLQLQMQMQNPATLKRNVLASFTSLLLLPVTIVPRTVGAMGGALMTGGNAAVQGIAMLNPQRWGAGGNSGGSGSGSDNGYGTGSWGNGSSWGNGGSWSAGGGASEGYSRNLDKGGALFEIEDGDEDGEDVGLGNENEESESGVRSSTSRERDENKNSVPLSQLELASPTPLMNSTTPSSSTTPSLPHSSSPNNQQLDLLLSLDVALEIIHADRESLKRVETFTGYPGHYGHRVRDTIEEIFVLALGALGERHVVRGFMRATERMKAYKPSEHSETTSVAPLVQFFELVHIGDTIQSIMQVYFDKELAPHIDKTDFLNTVVREKKRFENALDDSVAAGLNAGTEVLMNQVEHIILTLTKPREYYPPEDAPLELGPTKGCTEAIKCLENHCKLLKGTTSKEVLEVFYQEVGLRLIGILQKHIKRQIISLNGGFQVIADLNTYGAFIASLKIPAITADFSHLKMLGHVYVVEDAKDLAQIVKDVARYGGAYRPEDVYEFIQRRSDWKKIEKTVDKTMYNLSFKEDCTIC